MITLLQFPRPASRASISPFCLKLETFFRIAKIPYENKFTVSMGSSRKKKLPMIIDKGNLIEDSGFIIDYIKNEYGVDLDKHLDSEKKAIAKGFQWLCEKSIVEIVMYFRWVDRSNWPRFREVVFRGAPWLVKVTVANVMAKSIEKMLYKQGIGRFSEEEKLKILDENILAISNYLGTKKYFFGDQASSIDTIIFACLMQLTTVDIVPQFRGLLDRYPNIISYLSNFSNEVWPELKQ